MRSAEDDLYDASISRIQVAYQASGLHNGWRFLYTPRSTFSSTSPLWMLGLNPGGSGSGVENVSVEGGNSYRLRPWGPEGKFKPLQRQIQLFYEQLALLLDTTRDELMDSALQSNIAPFHSRSQQHLNAAVPDWRSVASQLWLPILSALWPRVIVTFAQPAYRCIWQGCESLGATLDESVTRPTGWGAVSWRYRVYSRDHRPLLVVRLPHLSRFGIFDRSKCDEAAAEITTLIADAIRRRQTERS